MPAFPTSTTVLDSILFRDAFGTPAMREVFSDFSLISRYAEIEIALAKAEARCGVISAEAADEIAKRTDVSALDFDLLRRERSARMPRKAAISSATIFRPARICRTTAVSMMSCVVAPQCT